MSFCIFHNVVADNHSLHNSSWRAVGSISISQSKYIGTLAELFLVVHVWLNKGIFSHGIVELILVLLSLFCVTLVKNILLQFVW